jgi:asparagine synthase (glutamine-hydrolysing)
MSGIAGIIHFDGATVEPGLVETMTAAMAHRGPDGIRHWIKGSVGLGQCMLCTTPESLEEQQPLANEDETLVLVMDGRLDNWQELRSELLGKGAKLRNRSDAELVLRAYETWGSDCLARLDGDFALVIWDVRRQTAFCARDRMGGKPLNYHWNGRTLAFASEVHALLALPWVPQELNEGIVAEYLANEWYSRDETFWTGVLRLVAAHQMVVTADGRQTTQYWQPELHSTGAAQGDEEYVEEYRDLLTDIVRRMSRSHRPIACEVSGGLDSSAVLAVAERLRRGTRLLAPGIQAYTLDFRGEGEADELEYVRAVREYLRLDVRAVAPTSRTVSWYQEQALRSREFPGYPNGEMSSGLRECAGDQGCRVLLSGGGGDQWLSGSRSYYAEALASRRWSELARALRQDAEEVGAKDALHWLLMDGVAPLLPRSVRRLGKTLLGPWIGRGYDRRKWLSPAMLGRIEQRAERHRIASAPFVARAGQRGLLAALTDAFTVTAAEMEERQAARAGVEVRQPFWSARMAQFALSVPARLMLSGRTNKLLHRRAMAGYLPESVLSRTTKADFTVVFRRHLDSMASELTGQIPGRRTAWVDREQAGVLYQQTRDRAFDARPDWLLWSLFGCDALCPVTK